jgi:outer membrane protein assembly factor BamB
MNNILRLLFILCFLAPPAVSLAQAEAFQMIWEKELRAGTAFQTSLFTACAADADGNAFVAGVTDTREGETDILVVKYSPAGEKLWQATYDGPLHAPDAANFIFPDPDGGATIVGATVSLPSGMPNLLMARFQEHGQQVWTWTYPLSYEFVPRGISAPLRDQDGAIWIGVDSSSYDAVADVSRHWGRLLKVTPSGQLAVSLQLPGMSFIAPGLNALGQAGPGKIAVCATQIDTTRPLWCRQRSVVYIYSDQGVLLETVYQAFGIEGTQKNMQAIRLDARSSEGVFALAFQTESNQFVCMYDDNGAQLWSSVVDTAVYSPFTYPADDLELHVAGDSTVWVLRKGVHADLVHFGSFGNRLSSISDLAHPGTMWLSFCVDPTDGLRVFGVARDLPGSTVDSLHVVSLTAQGDITWRLGVPIDHFEGSFGSPGACIDAFGSLCLASGAGQMRTSHGIVLRVTQAGSLSWQRGGESEGMSDFSLTDVAPTPSGGLFFTGSATNTSGFQDVVIGRLTRHGQPEWMTMHQGRGRRSEFPVAVLPDEHGNVFVACSELPNYESDSLRGNFTLVKYSGSGSVLWQRAYPPAGSVPYWGLLETARRSPHGEILLAGGGRAVVYGDHGEQRMVLTDVQRATINEQGEVFAVGDSTVRKFGSDGTLIWSVAWLQEHLMDLTATPDGGVMATCDYCSPAEFTLKVDSTGSLLWIQPRGGGTIQIAGDGSARVMRREGGVIGFSVAGNILWEFTPGMGEQRPYPVSMLDQTGSTYVAAELPGWGTPLAFAGYITRIAPDGGSEVVEQLSGPLPSYTPRGLCMVPSGEIYLGVDGRHYGMESLPIIRKYARITTDVVESSQLPQEMELQQNYPNPFNPTTSIAYALPQRGNVTLQIFDILGRQVATLVDETQNAGRYSVRWDASSAASGVYFYRLSAGERVVTRRMMLIK